MTPLFHSPRRIAAGRDHWHKSAAVAFPPSFHEDDVGSVQQGSQRRELRRRILDHASRRFSAEGVGLAALISEVGLTSGAFYAHFASKEDLVCEAVVDALNGVPPNLGLDADGSPAGLRRFIEAYLSTGHRDRVAEGWLWRR